MLTEIYMIHVDSHRHVAKLERALALRLEALTGEDPVCCAGDLRAEAKAARKLTEFDGLLLRAKALADEKRLLALTLLDARGEMCACEVQAALDLTHATVSHHMNCLLTAGLVTCERRGKWAYYAPTDAARKLIPRK